MCADTNESSLSAVELDDLDASVYEFDRLNAAMIAQDIPQQLA